MELTHLDLENLTRFIQDLPRVLLYCISDSTINQPYLGVNRFDPPCFRGFHGLSTAEIGPAETAPVPRCSGPLFGEVSCSGFVYFISDIPCRRTSANLMQTFRRISFVDSDSSACSIARNLWTAFCLLPAFRLSAGAFSSAISRMGPNFCVEKEGVGDDELPPADVMDHVLWPTRLVLSAT